jgi:hypothetical protein
VWVCTPWPPVPTCLQARLPRTAIRAVLLSGLLAGSTSSSWAQETVAPSGDASPPGSASESADAWQTLHVPADRPDHLIVFPIQLAPGDRLVIEAYGSVEGAAPDTAGDIFPGALVGSFAGGPPFLVGTGRLLWSAPSGGRLAFDVKQRAGRKLEGGYTVRVLAIGPRGDPRQRGFPPPSIAFLLRAAGGPILAVRYADRAGCGLDLKTLQVILDSDAGERFVLSAGFMAEADGATLPALPPDAQLPPGVHRVRATIGDALGNVSPAAEIFLDQPCGQAPS